MRQFETEVSERQPFQAEPSRENLVAWIMEERRQRGIPVDRYRAGIIADSIFDEAVFDSEPQLLQPPPGATIH